MQKCLSQTLSKVGKSGSNLNIINRGMVKLIVIYFHQQMLRQLLKRLLYLLTWRDLFILSFIKHLRASAIKPALFSVLGIQQGERQGLLLMEFIS